ncbi:MAG: family 10 glycosylhydrolase [Fimbriimonadaceae bacterium]|nr:family 10 glycosylhydrolase [Fimbriimonadaceae bacterium]
MVTALVSALLMATTTTPEPLREFRGVWVASVANIDWPSRKGLSNAELKAELDNIFTTCDRVHLNAVILQVRPSADALYASRYEPWSAYLSGTQGVAPADGFDPLAYAVKGAHKHGLELHVWLNPYRAKHPNDKGPASKDFIGVTHPEVVKQYGDYLWMDPGEKYVQDHSFNVFMDLVERYDIDGVHIDDYFYPYPVKGPDGKPVDFPDGPSYAKYLATGGRLNKDDWRRKNVDDFIKRVYEGIKKKKRKVKFGISPFGIYRPGVPEGIKSGVDQYAELYADCKKWFREGWCDYMTPQLYWPIKQTAQSFPTLLNWWKGQNVKGRHLWPGQYTSRTNPKEGNWGAVEVTDQIDITRKTLGKDAGTVHFSMKALMENWNGITDALLAGPYKERAVVPDSPWLD